MTRFAKLTRFDGVPIRVRHSDIVLFRGLSEKDLVVYPLASSCVVIFDYSKGEFSDKTVNFYVQETVDQLDEILDPAFTCKS